MLSNATCAERNGYHNGTSVPFTAFRQATPFATPTFLSRDFHEGVF